MKRNVVLYIAMSLDGYIAKLDGSVDWLKGSSDISDVDVGYNAFYQSIDTIFMGRKTYEQIIYELSPDKWVYKGKKTYVVTTKEFANTGDVTFLGSDFMEIVRELKKKEGKDIWLVGGASLIDEFQNQNLIDRYIITIIPTILGSGISLFDRRDKEILLDIIDQKEFGGMVQLTYVKR